MKLSLRWLGELVDLSGTTPEEVARRLTFHTAEVEGVEPLGQGLDGVVTARVHGVRPHPDADRLRLCVVDAGDGREREVVCGAPNVAAGQAVCYAPEGVTLPNGLTLTRRKIRGVESAGMICAEDELGLGTDHAGIIVLPEGTAPGQAVGEVLGATDTVLDVANSAITHRPDLWGHVGFARELGGLLGRAFQPPGTPAADAALAGAADEPFPVRIEDEEGCRRYVGLVVEGVVNGPSPLALRRRLESLGVRSIDLLVDLTNLVLLEQGQPLHAFDLRDIQGGEIVVRRARAGERMRTLDGVERALVEDDVVIADGRRPVALAGVMGGQDGEVRADTTAILLEAATFDPVRIRRTASRLGLRTEASSRFEKALDPVQAEAAARRFLELLLAHVPQARVTRRLADAYPRPYPPIRIALSYDVLRRRLGTRISDAGIRAHLASIGFEPKEEGGILHVQVPSWRATKDVSSAEDLYEEVGRLAGYEALPTTAPVGPLRPTRLPPLRRLERRLGLSLSLDRGYTEILSYAFYGARDAARVGLADTPHLGVLDSTSAEHDRLILTTAPNLLRAAARNQPRVASGRLWEITRLHAPRADGRGLPREARVLGLVAWERGGGEDAEGRLYLEVLEDLRHVLAAVPVTPLEVREAGPEPLVAGLPETSWLHPGRRAALVVGGRVLAVAGEVLPRVARAFDLEGRAVLAEATLEGILAVLGEPGAGYRPVHRFPVVPFDVAVVVPERTPAADVAAAIEGAVPDHVRGVRVFDVYAGEGIPTGARSLALTMELLDAEGTLKPEQADDLRARILAALVARGWTVRKGDESA